MDVQKDFADLCSLLNARSVDFLVVGGYAVAFHGAPRFTGDLDLLVRPSSDHVEKMLQGQVHVMTNITGVGWDQAWASRTKGEYGNVPVFFIGRRPQQGLG
jgi:hypothetical protein